MAWRDVFKTGLAAGALAIAASVITAAPAKAWGGGVRGFSHGGGGWSGGLHAGFGFRGGWGGWRGGYGVGYARPGWGYGHGWGGYPGYRAGFGYGVGYGGFGYPGYYAAPVVYSAPAYGQPYVAPVYHHHFYRHVAHVACR